MPSTDYRLAGRALTPVDRIVDALELRHPALPQPARLVADTAPLTIGAGEDAVTYSPCAFDAPWPEEGEVQRPRTRIAIDNVGRTLSGWIAATRGAAGATITLRRILISNVSGPVVEEEITLDTGAVEEATPLVTMEAGFGIDLLSRPAVQWRHDPRRSPGLF